MKGGEHMNEPFVNARRRTGMSQMEVAQRLDIDQSSVAYWETGKNVPRASMLVKLADLYCCTIDELMGRSVGQNSA